MTFEIEVVYRVAGQVFNTTDEAQAHADALTRTAEICDELRVWLYARTPLGAVESENVAIHICGEHHAEFVAILDKVRA